MAKDANTHVHFDIDAVDIILDSGYYFTISFFREDFITFRPNVGKVKGLSSIKLGMKYC